MISHNEPPVWGTTILPPIRGTLTAHRPCASVTVIARGMVSG